MIAPTVFISYSHKDEEWKDRLVTHLNVLKQEGILDLWDDRRIEAGDDWKPEIENAINRAAIAVLLILVGTRLVPARDQCIARQYDVGPD